MCVCVLQVQRLAVLNWIWYASFATWTAEATYKAWTQYLTENSGDIPIQGGADHYGYEIGSYGRSITALICIGLGFRAIAVYLIWRKSLALKL